MLDWERFRPSPWEVPSTTDTRGEGTGVRSPSSQLSGFMGILSFNVHIAAETTLLVVEMLGTRQ